MLDIAQFLFPDACQLTALEQFLADKVNEFDTRRRGYEPLLVTLYIVPLEEGLDDAGTR